MTKEIIINTMTPEEMEEIAKQEESNLLKRMLIVGRDEAVYISDMITGIHKRLKNFLDNINN